MIPLSVQARVTVTVSLLRHQLVKVASNLPLSVSSVAAFSATEKQLLLNVKLGEKPWLSPQ